MDNDNYKLYTKDVLNLIFSNQDIDQLIPYLSKNVKAMGLYTEDVLKYNDIINHIKTYNQIILLFILISLHALLFIKIILYVLLKVFFTLIWKNIKQELNIFIQLYLKIIK